MKDTQGTKVARRREERGKVRWGPNLTDCTIVFDSALCLLNCFEGQWEQNKRRRKIEWLEQLFRLDRWFVSTIERKTMKNIAKPWSILNCRNGGSVWLSLWNELSLERRTTGKGVIEKSKRGKVRKMSGMKSEIHAHPSSLENLSALICEEFDDNQQGASYQYHFLMASN